MKKYTSYIVGIIGIVILISLAQIGMEVYSRIQARKAETQVKEQVEQLSDAEYRRRERWIIETSKQCELYLSMMEKADDGYTQKSEECAEFRAAADLINARQ